jgi:hypothetical protein
MLIMVENYGSKWQSIAKVGAEKSNQSRLTNGTEPRCVRKSNSRQVYGLARFALPIRSRIRGLGRKHFTGAVKSSAWLVYVEGKAAGTG